MLHVSPIVTSAHIAAVYRNGGEMLEKLKEAERYNETDAANTVHKIVDALVYIHSKGIAHRDLKVRLPLAGQNCV